MDSIVQRFQQSPLDALEFLKEQSNLTPEQCCEVIEFELADKVARGEPVRIEPYLEGCPTVANSEDSLLRLILAEHHHRPTIPQEVIQPLKQSIIWFDFWMAISGGITDFFLNLNHLKKLFK